MDGNPSIIFHVSTGTNDIGREIAFCDKVIVSGPQNGKKI